VKSVRGLVASAMIAGIAFVACTASPQTAISYPAVARGTGESTMHVREWTITLTRADVAFGPAYFCAAASGSSTLCDTALAELTTITRVNALSATPTPLGLVHALTGTIRSASYDVGITWLHTEQQPTATPAAPDGHSAVLEGTATNGVLIVPFVVLVDAAPQYQGQHAVATTPVAADVYSDDVTLQVRFDPIRWVSQIDFAAAAARSERPVVFASGSVEHSAVLVGLKNLAPPELVWDARPR
jgi:hypothetical protein